MRVAETWRDWEPRYDMCLPAALVMLYGTRALLSRGRAVTSALCTAEADFVVSTLEFFSRCAQIGPPGVFLSVQVHELRHGQGMV